MGNLYTFSHPVVDQVIKRTNVDIMIELEVMVEEFRNKKP
jgi:hypothetical protein